MLVVKFQRAKAQPLAISSNQSREAQGQAKTATEAARTALRNEAAQKARPRAADRAQIWISGRLHEERSLCSQPGLPSGHWVAVLPGMYPWERVSRCMCM